jgi:hypothetical protein
MNHASMLTAATYARQTYLELHTLRRMVVVVGRGGVARSRPEARWGWGRTQRRARSSPLKFYPLFANQNLCIHALPASERSGVISPFRISIPQIQQCI